jgi:hypothetical protein
MRYFVVVVFIALFGCAGSHLVQEPYAPEQMVHFSEIQSLKSVESLNKHIIYMNPGDSLPLKLSFETEWLDIKQKQVDLVAKNKMYFRLKLSPDMTEEKLKQLVDLDPEKLSAMNDTDREKLFKGIMLYLSKDALHWASMNDPRAVKEVLGFKTGMIFFGAGMSDTEGVWSILEVKTSR